MDQEVKIQQYVLLAKGARGRGVTEVIARATSDPSVFGFGELLDVQSTKEVRRESRKLHLVTTAILDCVWGNKVFHDAPPFLSLRALRRVAVRRKTKLISACSAFFCVCARLTAEVPCLSPTSPPWNAAPRNRASSTLLASAAFRLRYMVRLPRYI